MARLPRLCIPGWPHLLVQLGHGSQAVFRDDADRRLFLDLLQEAAITYGVAIHAYALRDSEIRLLGTPSKRDSLSRVMQAIGRRYGSSFNRRHAHVGSLWGGRFRATVIEPERHLLSCMRYVEQPSPGESSDAGSERSPWSSAPHHFGERSDPCISDHREYWALGNTPFDREASYKKLTQQALTSSELSLISDAALKGWPLGSPAFLSRLSGSTDRRLMPLPRGRPTKKVDNQSAPN